ncbi:MAG: molybdopterin-dependent oxidoreductase [Caldiserica bacterium]|nr:molybdopterin-dependent oxidoreductase [Caldisericota bacterium]
MLADDTNLSVCAYDCPDSCGMVATCRDGRLVELEGRKDNPYTRGFICHKGRRWVRDLRGRDRLTSPLLRRNGKFVPIGWDEALDMTARAIQLAVQLHGHQSFLFYEGSGNLLMGNKVQRLLPLMLGGGTMATGSLCSSEGKAGLARSYGTVGRDQPSAALKSKSILLWGRNPAENSVHFLAILHDARRAGARIGTIEVRATPTTEASDSAWIVRPGSDLTLALYLCHEAVLLHGEPQTPYEGYELFRQACLMVSAEDAQLATGLSAEALHALVSFVVDQPPLSIWMGVGLQRTQWGADLVHTIDTLGFLLGNHGILGGGVWFELGDDGLLPNDFAVVHGAQTRLMSRPSLGASLLEAEPPVEAAMFVRGNPASQNPDAGKVLQFLKQCPFSVCLDWHMSVTARACSLVLPITVFLERGGDYVMSYFHDLLQKTTRTAEPPEGVRDELDIVRDVALRLGLPDRFTAEMTRLADVESDPRLTPVGPGMWRLAEAPRIRGTFHFPSTVPSVPSEPGMLRLITVHVRDYINGIDPAQARVRVLPPVAAVSTKLAREHGLTEGQRMTLRNALGSLDVRIHLDKSIAEETIVLAQGVEGVNVLVAPGLTANGNSCINDTWVLLEPVQH